MYENNNVLKTKFTKRKSSLTHTHADTHTRIHTHTQSTSLNSNPSSNNYPTGHMENFGKH